MEGGGGGGGRGGGLDKALRHAVSGDRGLSLVPVVALLQSGEGGEANSRAELTAFSEARVLGEKVWVYCADGLQRPEKEKKNKVSDSYFPTLS